MNNNFFKLYTNRILKIFNNEVLLYLFSRYFSYFIQFINSIIIAYKLGPYYLGIWGFLIMVMQYLSLGNFGLDFALTANLSMTDVADKEKRTNIVSNAIFCTFLTNCFFVIFGILIWLINLPFLNKYKISNYLFFIICISCLTLFNNLFINIFRIYSLYVPISIFQILVQIFQLPLFFFIKGQRLIMGLLVMISIAHVLSLIIFLNKTPIKISLRFDFNISKNLYKRGIVLLLYNLSFVFLLLSARTMISIYFPVEKLGLFTFASNIASAIILGISSLEFILFPKMLNRMGSKTGTVMNILGEVRRVYLCLVYIAIILSLSLYPLLLIYFNKYSETSKLFSYLTLCQIMIASGFGYSVLLISRGKEMVLASYGMKAIGFNILFSFIGYKWLKLDFSYSALFLLASLCYYQFQVIKEGRKLLKLEEKFAKTIMEIFQKNTIVSFVLIIVGIITNNMIYFNILALVIFFLLNITNIKIIIEYIKTLLHNPSIVDI